MPMMRIREVSMGMNQRHMFMIMAVFHAGRHGFGMIVPMMLVVYMFVLMRHRFVSMHMDMALGQMH